MSVAAMVVAVVGLIALPCADAAPILLNQYNNAPGTWVDGGGPGGANTTNADGTLDQGDGSTNITTTSSGHIGLNSNYQPDNVVDGNFAGFSPGPGDVGGVLQGSGFYGHTTDPDPHSWIAGGAGFENVTVNQQWISFSFTDGPHDFDDARVWNGNEVAAGGANAGDDNTFRGVGGMYVWYSNDVALPTITRLSGGGPSSIGPGWTLDGGLHLLSPGTALGTYDGETVNLGGFTARHIAFVVNSNQGVNAQDWVSLSEVQFFSDVPEPSTLILLVFGSMAMLVGRRPRHA